MIAFEVKSFFDSPGIVLTHFTPSHDLPEGKYKMFTCAPYRDIVFKQLRADLVSQNLITSNFKIKLGLIAGNGRKPDIENIRALFQKQGGEFWAPEDVKAKVKHFASEGYENDPAVITTKILER